MLRDCIEIFKKIYDEKGERLILDSYELSAGTYRTILVEDDAFRVIETVEIGRTKKDENQGDGMDPGLYYELKFYDYHSKLLGTNKAVDTKKAIHSNNYMAFFVKKNSIAEGKIDGGAMDRYYDTLKDPFIKYKKGNTADIYREFEGTNGAPDGELIEKIRLFVKSGKCWDDIDCSRKDYLKIFFLLPDKDETETLYRKEGARYLVPNLYLNNDYNISIQGRILGLPGNNMGMNSKKPYLLHKTRMVETPYLLERETAMMQNLFFDYLLGNVSKGKANIYLGDGGGRPMMISVSDWETPGAVSDGYYLRLQKGKNGAEIIKADVVTHYSSSMEEPFILKTYVPSGAKPEESRLPYGEKIRELEKLKDLIDKVFFKFDISCKVRDVTFRISLYKHRKFVFAARLRVGIESSSRHQQCPLEILIILFRVAFCHSQLHIFPVSQRIYHEWIEIMSFIADDLSSQAGLGAVLFL